jgi:hypothetical protein
MTNATRCTIGTAALREVLPHPMGCT